MNDVLTGGAVHGPSDAVHYRYVKEQMRQSGGANAESTVAGTACTIR
jgi:hypothetical protein